MGVRGGRGCWVRWGVGEGCGSRVGVGMACVIRGEEKFLQDGGICGGVGNEKDIRCMAVKGQERVAEGSAINISGLFSRGSAARLAAQALSFALPLIMTHSILWYN